MNDLGRPSQERSLKASVDGFTKHLELMQAVLKLKGTLSLGESTPRRDEVDAMKLRSVSKAAIGGWRRDARMVVELHVKTGST